MTTPRTITVAGAPIRLYPPPGEGRQFPWSNFGDLLRATDFHPDLVPVWAHAWQEAYPDRSHKLPDGQLLVPNESVLGLFDAARIGGWERAERAMKDYVDGSVRYFVELNCDLRGAAFRRAVHEAVLRSTISEVAH